MSNGYHEMPEINMTPGQERTYQSIRNDHPDAMLDWPGTQSIRRMVRGGDLYVSVIATDDTQVFMWILDGTGDVVEEGGARPRE